MEYLSSGNTRGFFLEDAIKMLFDNDQHKLSTIVEVRDAEEGTYVTVRRGKELVTYKKVEQLRARRMTYAEKVAFRLAVRRNNVTCQEYSRLEASCIPVLSDIVRMLSGRGNTILKATAYSVPDSKDVLLITRRCSGKISHKLYTLDKTAMYRRENADSK
jgi:hypothetical protein